MECGFLEMELVVGNKGKVLTKIGEDSSMKKKEMLCGHIKYNMFYL